MVDKITEKKVFQNLRPDILICLFLIMVTLTLYCQVRNHEYIDYDDDRYVTENPHVQKGLTKDGIIWAFKSTFVSNWHPLTWLSHMMDVQFYGMNSGAHHLTNVLFHIANTLLLFLVLRRMTGELWKSSFVAILFALHPLHVESVAWVAERKDVLSTLFWMLTMYSYVWYVERPGFGRYLTVLVFFIMGLMAKPMLVTLPFVLLLIDYWPLDRFQFKRSDDTSNEKQHKLSNLSVLYEKIPLFFFTAASCVITFLAQKSGGAIGSLNDYALKARIVNALVSYMVYIKKMVWPAKLAILYPHPERFPWWQVAGSFLLIVAISFLVYRGAKRRPWLIVGWLWYLGTLVPVIGLIQVGVQAAADRYTYIPLIGLFIIVGWGITDIYNKLHFNKLWLCLIATTLVSLMITTSIQLRYWKNSVSLFEHALNVTVDNYVIHNNLGFTLTRQGKVEKALGHYKEALKINPGFELANINLGVYLIAKGKVDECICFYQDVLKMKPSFLKMRVKLGNMLLQKGNVDDAIIHFREALRTKHDYAEAHNSLGAAMLFKGKTNEAISSFREALQIKPDFIKAQNNLKKILDAKNKNGLLPKIVLDSK